MLQGQHNSKKLFLLETELLEELDLRLVEELLLLSLPCSDAILFLGKITVTSPKEVMLPGTAKLTMLWLIITTITIITIYGIAL